MVELQKEPAVIDLLKQIGTRQSITYGELNDFLPDTLTDSDMIEDVIAFLENMNITIEDEEKDLVKSGDEHLAIDDEPDNDTFAVTLDEDDAIDDDLDDLAEDILEDDDDKVDDDDDEDDVIAVRKRPDHSKKVLYNDKEASIDDPIRLYLREIGKESLLTAEQEVELSKKMENGENIIKDVTKDSGIMITGMFSILQKLSQKFDEKEMDLTKKELTEFFTEQKRLNQAYRDQLRDSQASLKSYIEQKNRIIASGGDILADDGLQKKKAALMKKLAKIDLQQDEIIDFTTKFLATEEEIFKFQNERDLIEARLGVSSVRELRQLYVPCCSKPEKGN